MTTTDTANARSLVASVRANSEVSGGETVSNFNEYRHPLRDTELEKVIIAARKSTNVDIGKFDVQVVGVVLGEHKDDIGLLDRYEVIVTPEPDEPGDKQYHFMLTIMPRVIPEAYPQIVGQLMHTVERYWKDKRAKHIISELTADERDLLLMFKEQRYFELEDYLSQYTRLELESFGATASNTKPKLSMTDKRLIQLEGYGLIQVDEMGIFKMARLTNDGMYTAYLLSDLSESKSPRLP